MAQIAYIYAMVLRGLEKTKKFYFIGIGGISMSSLAKLMRAYGYAVCGSDAQKNEQTEKLVLLGVNVYIGVDATRTALRTCDAVVYTDAISERHEELQTAKALKKRIFSRAELLKIVCENASHTLAVAGSHGKTTCTSMCAHALKSTDVPFAAHIGGEDALFGNFYYSGLEYFVTEACEYKQNLLRVPAESAVVLNIDNDHMECYRDEKELINCFYQYAFKAKTAFVCADDARCLSLGDFSTFGIHNPLADYRAVDLRANGERYSFTVEEYGKALCRLRLKAIGKCNVYNALAAFACLRSFGFDEQQIRKGIENFQAVKRRFEKIGRYRGATVICDYAHHPREIAATIATAKGVCKGKLFVVFQPHTYSRTKLLMPQFVETLNGVERLMIYKTYAAREKYDEEGSAETLAGQVGNSLYSDNIYTLKTWIKTTVREGDTLLFLGAGDIYYVAQYLVKAL